MTEYVCTQLSDLNGVQTCTAWIEHVSIIDSFAITTTQASAICVAIASYFALCYILKLSRSSVK